MEFWFEFGSTYCYPAAARIESLAAEREVAVSWRVFLLGPLFREQGLSDSPFKGDSVKGRYMWRDLERICGAQGLPLRRPSQFPRSGLIAARVACRFARARWLPAFVRSIYRANFEQDTDISAIAAVADCLASSGANPGPVLEEAQSPEGKARLRAQTEQAAGLGIFGAPSFRVGSELFWGNDRLDVALEWAARSERPARSRTPTR